MPESKVIINYQDIIAYIGEELQYIWQELINSENDEISSLIKNIKSIEVSDEQYFRKQEGDRKLRRGTVYLVVRFSSGAINYASSVTPISIYGLGTANQVKPVQLLLGTFSSFWTTKNMRQGLTHTVNGTLRSLEVGNMLQVWNTPEIVSNFNVLDDDFRSLYRTTGNIVIGPNAVRLGTLSYYYKKKVNGVLTETSENINIMSFQDSYHSSLDSQPFGDTNGFAQSETNFSTYTFSISTYLLNSQFARDLLAMRGFRYRPSDTYTDNSYDSDGNPRFSIADPNMTVKVKLEFTNNFNNKPGSGEQASVTDPVKGDDFYMFYKVVDSRISQELAGIPTLTVTFAR